MAGRGLADPRYGVFVFHARLQNEDLALHAERLHLPSAIAPAEAGRKLTNAEIGFGVGCGNRTDERQAESGDQTFHDSDFMIEPTGWQTARPFRGGIIGRYA